MILNVIHKLNFYLNILFNNVKRALNNSKQKTKTDNH